MKMPPYSANRPCASGYAWKSLTVTDLFMFGACSWYFGAAHRIDEGTHVPCVLDSGRRFDSARHIHGERPHAADGFPHIAGIEATREDPRSARRKRP